MAGIIGIGIGTEHEPILLDGAGLGPASWDIILESGFGPSSIITNQQGQDLKIEAL
jgi:hypothetical protein